MYVVEVTFQREEDLGIRSQKKKERRR